MRAASVYLSVVWWMLVGSASGQLPRGNDATYAPSASCRSCHAKIFESYQRTGMARSFYQPALSNVIEDYRNKNQFHDDESGRYYRMVEREGKFYQQRFELDENGHEANQLEVEITHVIGSGNHARSYLHLAPSGELTELPITWYPQEHRWAMSPGYERIRHNEFSREVDYACLFCHNSDLRLPARATRYGMAPRFPRQLPQGIDCQRCHGPGARHIALASTKGSGSEAIRAAVVNPARLSAARQMGVCEQCHLETTSGKLPHAMPRFDRPAFSFRPGEQLSDYMIYFDHPRGTGHEDKFEIVNASYRLRQSLCFQKSAGRLTCITCHDPHVPLTAGKRISVVCRSCHAQVAAPRHDDATSDCIGCHMPKRRTEDVVHVVMTDHRIQRKAPDRDPLAPLKERDPDYHGDVALYEPKQLPQPERDLYLGMALVKDGADRERGIGMLEKGIAAAGAHVPAQAFIELAWAYAAIGNPGSAAKNYQKALAIDPVLPLIRYDLASALAQLGDTRAARREYERAIHDDPDLAEAHNNLGTLLAQANEPLRAADEYEAAIRVKPFYADAHNNLANLFFQQGRIPEANSEIAEALRSDSDFGPACRTRGMIFATQRHFDLAAESFERVVKLEPESAAAHLDLGRARVAQGDRKEAIVQYRQAIQLSPRLTAAHVSLGIALAREGEIDAAIAELREALRWEPADPTAAKYLDQLLKLKSGQK